MFPAVDLSSLGFIRRARLYATEAAKEYNNIKKKVTKKNEIMENGFENLSSAVRPASKKRRRKGRELRRNPISSTGNSKASKGWRGGAASTRRERELLRETGSDIGLTVEVDEHGYNYGVYDADLPSTALNTANTDGSVPLDYDDSSLNMGACILSGIKSGQPSREYFPSFN